MNTQLARVTIAYDAYDRADTCAHPDHWRKSSPGDLYDNSCRLCGAMSWTIARQIALRQAGRREE